MSPTLELLRGMLEDVDSPTHGKVGDVPVVKYIFSCSCCTGSSHGEVYLVR